VGAYVSGMLFGQNGKHKLFPSISPKKSWEGFIGGLLIALVTGYVLWLVDMLPYALVHVLVISLLIAVFGVFGDLVESMLKRSVGVKDSGHIMPGHGGLLDRFDAALFALPVTLFYMKIFSLL
jgi:phosphatidate cytidylyltransferase